MDVDLNRDRGGRILPGKKWRLFNFVVEVAVESPKTVDEDEAAEDACDFMNSIARSTGRVNESFASVTRVDEYGAKRPKGAVVIIRDYPKGNQVQVKKPRGISSFSDYEPKKKVKVKKAKKKVVKRR